MNERKRLRYKLSSLIVCVTLFAIAFTLLRIVLPFKGVFAAPTPPIIVILAIAMYSIYGGALGGAVSVILYNQQLRGAVVGASVPPILFLILRLW